VDRCLPDVQAAASLDTVARSTRMFLSIADSTPATAVSASAAVTPGPTRSCAKEVLLLRLLVAELEATGLRVLTHSRVPPNGVNLGQVVAAAARDELRDRRPRAPKTAARSADRGDR
jgi:hydrogenase maturation protein HypF